MLSNSPKGAKLVFLASLVVEHQRFSEAKQAVVYAKQAQLVCYSCRTLQPATVFDASTNLCPACYDDAGWENEHSDTGGDHDGMGWQQACPTCRASMKEHMA